MNYKEIIKNYFNSWIEKNPEIIKKHFSENVLYTECYGPVYVGKTQCLNWFTDWNQKGSVLQWDIKKTYSFDNSCVAEWYFKCKFEGNIEGFDGVSIIEFNEHEKIISVKEFQSKSEHSFPYEKDKDYKLGELNV